MMPPGTFDPRRGWRSAEMGQGIDGLNKSDVISMLGLGAMGVDIGVVKVTVIRGDYHRANSNQEVELL